MKTGQVGEAGLAVATEAARWGAGIIASEAQKEPSFSGDAAGMPAKVKGWFTEKESASEKAS